MQVVEAVEHFVVFPDAFSFEEQSFIHFEDNDADHRRTRLREEHLACRPLHGESVLLGGVCRRGRCRRLRAREERRSSAFPMPLSGQSTPEGSLLSNDSLDCGGCTDFPC